MQSSPTKLPAHEQVYRKLRDMVLFGDLAPGQSVTIQGLVDQFEVSMTPVREAIRRLTAEGALELQDNRRICVPTIGPRRFRELSFARLFIEPKLAEMATPRIDSKGLAQLSAIDADLNLAITSGDVKGYMRHNHRFHFTLYGFADSPILLPMAETLWLRFGPLYRIISGRYGTRNLVDQHAKALQHLAEPAPEAVAKSIQQDIEQGLQIVADELFDAAIDVSQIDLARFDHIMAQP